MVQCWRKSRKLGVEPGLVPHCPNWPSYEAAINEMLQQNEAPLRNFLGYSSARTMPNTEVSLYHRRN